MRDRTAGWQGIASGVLAVVLISGLVAGGGLLLALVVRLLTA